MKHGKRDLVVHYDEVQQEFVFYSTPTDKTEVIRETEFGGCRISISDLKEKSPSDAEQAVGGAVLSLLDLGAMIKAGIRDYAAEADKAERKHRALLEQQVKNGDAEASYQLAISLHFSAMKHGSLADLERAETLFDTAARAGHPWAIKTMKTWPDMKEAALRTIQRRESGLKRT